MIVTQLGVGKVERIRVWRLNRIPEEMTERKFNYNNSFITASFILDLETSRMNEMNDLLSKSIPL